MWESEILERKPETSYLWNTKFPLIFHFKLFYSFQTLISWLFQDYSTGELYRLRKDDIVDNKAILKYIKGILYMGLGNCPKYAYN